ncbi:SIR2 family protein [Marispirochaeta aestuarii]|uniref:SIR2 family protein n=1 Tax=Marispirochaeta aestuarii TaxID=1963862 RepID=UPI0029C882EB|nr:SIR2 family protein [Marispirochaeta aestuarii]
MDIDTSIYHVLNGDAVLFTGSGFSYGAINQNNEKFKTGNNLAKKLYDEVSLPFENEPLEEAVEEYLEKYTKNDLIKLLKNEFTVKQYSNHHKVLTEMNWKRIYTTNYDNIIKTISNEIGKQREDATLSDKPWNISNKYGMCLHLNGCIEKLDIDTLNEEFKLTEKSYLTEEFLNNDWITFFRDDLKNCKTIIFIGYSLNYDLDIKKILFNTEELKDKCFFIVSENESESNIRRMKKIGQVYPIGIEEYSEIILEKSKTHIPLEENEKALYAFKKYNNEYVQKEIRDDDVYNFLVYGKVDLNILYQSITNEHDLYHYAFNYEEIEQVKNWFDEGIKNVVLHSDLGNGKTIFKDQLAILCIKDYDVYEILELCEGWEEELEFLMNQNRKKMIIIENYSKYRKFFEKLLLYRNDENTYLFLTERTLLNTVNLHNYNFKEENRKIIDINCLSNLNIDRLITLFNHYKFIWGKHSNKTHIQKKILIKKYCDSILQKVMINIVYSKDIINRFAKIYAQINENRAYSRILLLSLLNSAMSFDLDVDEIVYLLDRDIVSDVSFREDPVVNELISFDNNQVKIKNSVLAKILLTKIKNLNLVFNMMTDIAIRADGYTIKNKYYHFLRKINSYTDLRFVFGDHKAFSKEIIIYFEKIKNLRFFRNNAHFWLQYAIARLELKEYDKADKCFNTAYSMCDENDTARYFIDNHYSRFLLERALIKNAEIDPYKNFINAHDLLINSRQTNDAWDYTFKVALNNYEPYYKFYEKDFSNKQKEHLKNLFKQILGYIDRFKRTATNYHIEERSTVKKCEESIRRLLN